jgi:acetolactate synthase I/II/III large subunit
VHSPGEVGPAADEAFALAAARHRGPVFLDASLEALFGAVPDQARRRPGGERPPPDLARAPQGASGAEADPDAITAIARLLGDAERPVVVLGSDVWMDRAEVAARAVVEQLQLPVIANGQGRGILAGGHPLLVTRARGVALGEADLVIVAGTPLDFRLGYGSFGGKNGTPPARVVHVVDAPDQVAAHCDLAGAHAGDIAAFFDGLVAAAEGGQRAWVQAWLPRLQQASAEAVKADAGLLRSDARPIHPMRIYGELTAQLEPDAVIIGDGGDFVSYAGKYLEPQQPGGWLDPGPYGCLGTGLGYAIAARVARPEGQVVLLLGDGAAGFSLMDVDTLVRHQLPVVMVCGNNGIWGLEKHPMQGLYGYDVAADLQPGCRYDEVVGALGGAGELVTEASQIAPALRRAFAAGVPYMVNVVTDPKVAYPRSTTGV